MKVAKNLGIWMDYSRAHLIDIGSDIMEPIVIDSNFTPDDKAEVLSKSEHMMHNKEQQHHADYFKRIGEALKPYESVLLFGPTNAKLELLNILKEDNNFENIHFEVKSTDKMPDKQQHAFVKEHFSK